MIALVCTQRTEAMDTDPPTEVKGRTKVASKTPVQVIGFLNRGAGAYETRIIEPLETLHCPKCVIALLTRR